MNMFPKIETIEQARAAYGLYVKIVNMSIENGDENDGDTMQNEWSGGRGEKDELYVILIDYLEERLHEYLDGTDLAGKPLWDLDFVALLGEQK